MHRFVRFAFALSFVCLVSNATAQQTATTSVPNLIRYSGTLQDAQGAALSSATPIGVTFAIYKEQEGGAPVWQETQNVTPEANGQYNVILGSTTATGLPDDLFSKEEQRWLGVQLQGQAEQPRVLLVSVPYAFKAHEADTLGGLPASAFVKAPSRGFVSGSADGTAVNALSAPGGAGVGSGSSKGPPAGPIAGGPCPMLSISPAPFYIPIFVNSTTICNSVIYQTPFGALGSPGPNVGIGTVPVAGPSPTPRLDVAGDINAADDGNSYQIGKSTVLQISGIQNLFLGIGAGSSNGPGGALNTFLGSQAGHANTSGTVNTFVGFEAGYSNTTGNSNTFIAGGSSNTTGSYNTFTGGGGAANTTGSFNVVSGVFAGGSNTTGSYNTYTGYSAGFVNTGESNTFTGRSACGGGPTGGQVSAGSFNTCTGGFSGGFTQGSYNTFTGYQAGYGSNAESTANYNTFTGYQAGYSTTSGDDNTFYGSQAGFSNTTGYRNTFIGEVAGQSNTAAEANTFVGYGAGLLNVTGMGNTFLGHLAGPLNDPDGNFNIFVGFVAGQDLEGGSNNIYLGNKGLGTESNAIRIGGDIGEGYGTQTAAYIAGIYNAAVGGAPNYTVCVDAGGKLWGTAGYTCTPSSRRFKEQIGDMADSSNKLFQLRPVSFFYKPQYDDGSHLQQYGLIAEEVAKVYPEMVVYDKDGQPYSVRYQLLAPMLLNELQKEHTVVMAQQDQLQTQLRQIKVQRQEIEGLKLQLQQQNASLQERLTKLESYVETQMKTASDKAKPTAVSADGGSQ